MSKAGVFKFKQMSHNKMGENKGGGQKYKEFIYLFKGTEPRERLWENRDLLGLSEVDYSIQAFLTLGDFSACFLFHPDKHWGTATAYIYTRLLMMGSWFVFHVFRGGTM